VLAVADEPARGRKPVLRDELAAVVVKQQCPPERLRFFGRTNARNKCLTQSMRQIKLRRTKGCFGASGL
ncbi:MAG: hypothetical protein JXA30_18660, partial [Deltaproteobacteria bacterium]|nr:hypothetical protein [Deltaproteobacteria bacterium]